ncbi:MAG: hypothetical protein K1X44_07430 [Alphaproteobacteria bacterium]|nr:hypothetical protein [Alphaproteobacteria bacterium]
MQTFIKSLMVLFIIAGAANSLNTLAFAQSAPKKDVVRDSVRVGESKDKKPNFAANEPTYNKPFPSIKSAGCDGILLGKDKSCAQDHAQ